MLTSSLLVLLCSSQIVYHLFSNKSMILSLSIKTLQASSSKASGSKLSSIRYKG